MQSSGSYVFTVWPYFILSGLSGLMALVFFFFVWPTAYPSKSELVKVSGKIATVTIKDDISKTGAGAMLPGFTSVYFMFEGIQGEFKYPYNHPQYQLVRNHTAGSLDVWVDSSELKGKKTMIIWQLQEHSHLNYTYPATFVTYEEIIARHVKVDQSIFNLCSWLVIACCILGMVGIGLRCWNQRKSSMMMI
jgi:hypothetical protein